MFYFYGVMCMFFLSLLLSSSILFLQFKEFLSLLLLLLPFPDIHTGDFIFYFYGLMCICFSASLRFLIDYRRFEGCGGGGFYGGSVLLKRLFSLHLSSIQSISKTTRKRNSSGSLKIQGNRLRLCRRKRERKGK